MRKGESITKTIEHQALNLCPSTTAISKLANLSESTSWEFQNTITSSQQTNTTTRERVLTAVSWVSPPAHPTASPARSSTKMATLRVHTGVGDTAGRTLLWKDCGRTFLPGWWLAFVSPALKLLLQG